MLDYRKFAAVAMMAVLVGSSPAFAEEKADAVVAKVGKTEILQ